MLLWRAALAKQELGGGARKKDVDFYEGQVKTAEFFIQTLLPTTMGKMNSIIKSNGSAIEISEAAFGGWFGRAESTYSAHVLFDCRIAFLKKYRIFDLNSTKNGLPSLANLFLNHHHTSIKTYNLIGGREVKETIVDFNGSRNVKIMIKTISSKTIPEALAASASRWPFSGGIASLPMNSPGWLSWRGRFAEYL